MKKIVFTLMTLLALIVVAGSANAQGKFAPNPGGTYHYSLPIVIANQSDAVLTATGLTTGTSVITNITPSLTNIATSVTLIEFDVTYSNDATGTCKIEFSITDEVSGCTNSIYLDVPMSPVPTYTLTLAKDVSTFDACQKRTGAGDNTADALGDGSEDNTFTFSVTPAVNGVTGNFTYSYTIDLPSNLVLLSFNNGSASVPAYSGGVVTYTGVSNVVTDVFTVSFKTTTGVATQTLAALVSIGAASTMTPIDGGGTYEATNGGTLSQSVTVNAVPTIGQFQ